MQRSPGIARVGAGALLLGSLVLAGCSREAELHAVEAKRDALLATTVPKSDFWNEVQRKGVALKEQQAVRTEIEPARARVEAEKAALSTLEQRLAETRHEQDEAAASLAAAKHALEQAADERREREETLRGFETRAVAAGDAR
ncbi:MAG TPA: hypothetical protein VMW35_07165 [Myxococcota bacterium]|jgi:chromosome segregation ATPase|nr:hypothetical protein [Myxococcota bacterium]